MLALVSAAPPASFSVVVTPNPANQSNLLTATMSPTSDSSFNYSCAWSSWNGSLQADSQNCTYIVPPTFNHSRVTVSVYSTNSTYNSTAITNYTLVFSANDKNSGYGMFSGLIEDFFGDWYTYILPLFTIGISWGLLGRISSTVLATGTILFALWLLLPGVGLAAPLLFIVGAFVMIAAGLVLKFVGV